MTRKISSAQGWFAGGERVGYDPNARALVQTQGEALRVFLRREGNLAHAVSFLPGFPDGSFGWAKVLPHLPSGGDMPKLFLDYVGMGDSDKPKDYAYSTAERTDLVEAIWRELGVQSTTVITFDFSSLVILEHLRRRLERLERGEPALGPEIRGVLTFNGGLFTDGHTHPWYTTPMLRRLPNRARPGVGRPLWLFKRMPGIRKMWSKGYQVTDAELGELHSAMDRHDGLFYLAAAAGFVADHKAQGERLDFGQLFMAYRHQFPFVVGGSEEDPFEHRQVALAEERLGQLGLRIERLPGGHLTTNEQPDAFADLIANFEQGLQKLLKGAFVMTDQSHSQTQTSNSTTTGVFALLRAKPGVTRERVMAVMPAEIRATVQLYLDGKIREWYSRDDGRGGVFLLNTGDVEEAKSIMESLPLAKEDMLDHEYIPVGPLMPLRLLMGSQSAKQ